MCAPPPSPMLVVRKLRLAQPTGLADGFVSTPCPVIKLTHLSLKRDLEEVKMLPAHTSTSDFTVSGVEIESRKQKCKAALPSPSSTRSRRAGPSGPTQRVTEVPGPHSIPMVSGSLSVECATAGGSKGWGRRRDRLGDRAASPPRQTPPSGCCFCLP